jgi:hypothetical protein
MKRLISIAFGAAALATVAFASPAEARSNVGIYIGPGGVGVHIGHYNKCRDYWYRRNHPYRCGYRHYYRERYYYNDYRYYRRHHKHHRYQHHRRDRDRWDRH